MAFASGLRFEDLPDEAVCIVRRCVLDGVGVRLAGSEQSAVAVLEVTWSLERQPDGTALLPLLDGRARR